MSSAAAIDDGRPVGYDSPDELGQLFERNGLAAVATGELFVAGDYASFDELWRPFAAGIGHSGACCVSLAPRGRPCSARTSTTAWDRPETHSGLTARVSWARGNTR